MSMRMLLDFIYFPTRSVILYVNNLSVVLLVFHCNKDRPVAMNE